MPGFVNSQKPDIFISYASADRPRVKPLVDLLHGKGWSVWWDRTILPARRLRSTLIQSQPQSQSIEEGTTCERCSEP